MAKILNVAHDLAVHAAEEAARAEALEMAAEENIVELLEKRGKFEELRKAAETLLENIKLANGKMDKNAATNADLSYEDTEVLLSNYDFIEVSFANTLSVIGAEYEALKAAVQEAAANGDMEEVCGCGGNCLAQAA